MICLFLGPGECASHMEYGSALKPLPVWVTSIRMSTFSKHWTISITLTNSHTMLLHLTSILSKSTYLITLLCLCFQPCVRGGAEGLSVPAGPADDRRRLGGGLWIMRAAALRPEQQCPDPQHLLGFVRPHGCQVKQRDNSKAWWLRWVTMQLAHVYSVIYTLENTTLQFT